MIFLEKLIKLLLLKNLYYIFAIYHKHATNMNAVIIKKELAQYIVSIIGLTIMSVCLLISVGYIKHELSYDRFHTKCGRIVRLSVQYDNEPIDGRVLDNSLDNVLQKIPEVEQIVKMSQIYSGTIVNQGEHYIVNNFYSVSSNFFKVFDIPLVYGNVENALQRANGVLISESFANKIFRGCDYEKILGSEITIDGMTLFISGIFKNIPDNSHFSTDILLHREEDKEGYSYTYLLLKTDVDISLLENKINKLMNDTNLNGSVQEKAILMYLTDIHLYSHNLKEMQVNGNIYYIYFIGFANLLLMVVVLFNLWLNSSLIFSYNCRYYQILRICGASSLDVFKRELYQSLIVGTTSILLGYFITVNFLQKNFYITQLSLVDISILYLIFLSAVIIISLLPSLINISYTTFINLNIDLKSIKFSYSNVRWMILIQYTIVMITVILAFGINKQMNYVKDIQVGGNKHNILVIAEQPEEIQSNYDLLKSELLKHIEIESVTSSFQLPGEAIRDFVRIRNGENMDWQKLPLMVVGEDFLDFFNIKLLAGHGFSPMKLDYSTELKSQFEFFFHNNKPLSNVEEYIINKKALSMLGFDTPEEALGAMFHIDHASLGYIDHGIIVGVTEDFNYTGLYEETDPLLILQRRVYQHCIMVKLAPEYMENACSIFEDVWNEVNPHFSPDYIFMNNVFDRIYYNEKNAEKLIYAFSVLCFVFANLGLITFVAFIIRRRQKEVGIRKVYGASISNIILMLNMNFVKFIGVAFIMAIPMAWCLIKHWLQRFAYRISLDWWLFLLAGLIVIFISLISITFLSLKTAVKNPAQSLMKN